MAQYRIFHLSINRVWLNLVVYKVILKLIQNYKLRTKWVVYVQLLTSSCVQLILPPLSKVSPEDDLHALFWKKPSMKNKVIWRNVPFCCPCCTCFLCRPQSLLPTLKAEKGIKNFQSRICRSIQPWPIAPWIPKDKGRLRAALNAPRKSYPESFYKWLTI